MIKKYNEFNQNSLKSVSIEDIKQAEEYLEKGKDPNWDFKLGYFFIDVSGKYSVYYTLWRTTTLKDYFITNLSTDFQTAVEKAKKATGRIPVIIDKTGTKAGLFNAAKSEIFTFGKHRGKTIGDVFVEDPQYIVWLSNNYDKGNSEFLNKIIEYKNLYFETITKQNIEKSESKYIGSIGDKITIEADIYDVKLISSFGKTTYNCKLIDSEKNKFITYNIGKNVKKGDTVKLSAKVKKHKEILGIKFTELYYCKVLNIWNIEDDSKKYNL